MTEGELKGILNSKVTNALGYYGGKLSQFRVKAYQYYNGEPFGNELEGRSQVVSRDLAEAIDSMMPPLMKIFSSGEEVVRFEPGSKDLPEGTPIAQLMAKLQENEDKAKQATDYCNWIWNQQNEGFKIFYDWFKDALLNRVGAIKIWWDEQEEVAKETYKGLTDKELEILLQDAEDDKLDIIEHDEYPDPDAPPPSAPLATAPPAAVGGMPPSSAAPLGQTPPNTGAIPGQNALVPPPTGSNPLEPGLIPPPPMPMLHDVVLRRTNKTGRVRILPIPGEEFLMDRRAVALEQDNPFCAHRVKKTISDLLEMGYKWDVVKNLGEGDSSDFNLERLERFRQEDELPYRTGNNYDPAMKEVWINECYMNVDWDGDGIAELRKIIFAGESGNFAPGATVILENEETDDNPFAALTPTPMPHKFYGMSTADQVMDLQLIKSTLWRNTLDHTYNAIMPQLGVIDSQVNLDDLLSRRPGGIVRIKQAGAIEPIPNGEMGVDPFQMISYIDQVREQRTGVRRFIAGPGADALNNAYTDTATGVNAVEDSAQERLELVARSFAEIGVKPAFRKILKLVTMHQNRPKIIRLRGKFVQMDPREWDDEFDMTVTVGLGTGNRNQQLQGMNSLLQVDQQIIQLQQGVNGPILTAENVYNKLAKICEYLGLKNSAPYYTDPSENPQSQQPKPAQPNPTVQAAQIKAAADQQATQLQIQADREKMQFQAQLDAKKAALQMQAEAQKLHLELAMKERIEMAKVAAQREIEYARLAADRAEFNAEAQLKIHQHATDTALRAHEINSRQSMTPNGVQ